MPEASTIEQILEMVHEVKLKVDRLSSQYDKGSAKSVTEAMDVMMLLSLPDKLRTTAIALIELEYGTASDVAKITHKRRAVESNYLNHLNKMGCVRKCRKGRKVYFCIKDRPDNHV